VLTPTALRPAHRGALALVCAALTGLALGCGVLHPKLEPVTLASAGVSESECQELLNSEQERDLSFLERAARQSLNDLARSRQETVQLAGSAITAQDLEQGLTILLAALGSGGDWVDKACAGLELRKIRGRHIELGGYYQPILAARHRRDDRFRFPVYEASPRRPPGTDVGAASPATRAEVDAAVLSGKAAVIGWLDDSVEALLLEIRGCALLRYEDGRWTFIAPATGGSRPALRLPPSIARAATERQPMSMASLRDYLRSHPEAVEALRRANPDPVFFRRVPNGPLGASGAMLTGGRSVAADSTVYPFGTVLLLAARNDAGDDPLGRSRLGIVQDTDVVVRGGGALDVYVGTGPDAGEVADRMNEQADVYVLLPKRPLPPPKAE
jgi:peptidoglycan lytic transglycosylase A